MSITLTLEDDLLAALRARSAREGRPVEAVATDIVPTDIVRRGLAEGLTSGPTRADELRFPPGDIRNAWKILPPARTSRR